MNGRYRLIYFAEFAEADLSDAFRLQVLSFLRIVWPDVFVGANRFRDHITDAALEPYHLLYAAETQLVSHLEIITTTVSVNGAPFRVQSLTPMLTYPAFRGEGWGSRLSMQAGERIDRSGADAGVLLCANDLVDFYRRSGWTPAPEVRVVAGPGEQTWTPTDVSLTRTTSPRSDHFLSQFQRHPMRIDGEW